MSRSFVPGFSRHTANLGYFPMAHLLRACQLRQKHASKTDLCTGES